MSNKPPVQVWEGVVEGRHHRVEMSGGLIPLISWTIDDEPVATKKVTDAKVMLAEPHEREGAAVRLVVRTTRLSTRPRRATVLGPEELIGGIDLTPAPGSPVAVHHDKVLAHPRRYTAITTLGAAAGVIVPIVVIALLARLATKIPWPDIPWPDIDLPSIPWPSIDLPSIPWPSVDLPDVTVPGWVEFVLDNAQYVVPVVVAFVVARAEIRRRRGQQLPAEERARTGDGSDEVRDEVRDEG
ncbi:hypothetical protein RB608_05840 [Nocardioides sp. LHD-245]|uniref:hypothetical protein n=1 Tax=Nocardioides sp. LHD-245 TaxID=3051387 RepID=UPI0027E0128A|nr:hypothetical protein [Nocardioides sp. LHD-245]